MKLDEMFRIAGIDPTKGKAKRLVEADGEQDLIQAWKDALVKDYEASYRSGAMFARDQPPMRNTDAITAMVIKQLGYDRYSELMDTDIGAFLETLDAQYRDKAVKAGKIAPE